ncbi:MAG: RNA polymerase sigma factor [Flavobacteriales bacterium]|nr:RNA polymerase sigma factor [Flavobacteriales bacterium]
MRKGNKQQQKFLTLYEPVHDRFERFCRARVFGNMEYQDLMNDTLLVAFEKLATLKSEKAFLSFIIGISVRILANHHKKKKEEAYPQQQGFDVLDVNSATERDAEIYLLHKALAMLPEQQRECIILFEISGFPIKEIMIIQNISESAVKQRLKRGREKLTEILTFDSTNKEMEVQNGTK